MRPWQPPITKWLLKDRVEFNSRLLRKRTEQIKKVGRMSYVLNSINNRINVCKVLGMGEKKFEILSRNLFVEAYSRSG